MIKKTILFSGIVVSILTTSLIASSVNVEDMDKKVISFSEKVLEKYEGDLMKIGEISILGKAKVKEHPEFKAYIMGFDLEINTAGTSSVKKLTDIFFVGESGVIATQLFSVDGVNLKELTVFPVKDDYYTKEHFLMGDPNAENKVLVFSDYYCPFCEKAIKKLEKFVKKNTSKVAIYVVDYPLVEIHPGAKIVAAIAKQACRKNMPLKKIDIYKKQFSKMLGSELNQDIIVKKAETFFGIEIDRAELSKIDIPNVAKDISLSRKLGISKTPTFFLNGIKTSIEKITDETSQAYIQEDGANSGTN